MSTRTTPAGRYPEAPDPRVSRRWLTLGIVVVLVAGVIVAWVGYKKFSDPDISGQATAHEVLSDHAVRVKFTVNRSDPGKAGSCVLRARDGQLNEVGRREVYIPPARDAQFVMEAVVASSARPSVGEVYGCSTWVPAYLVADPTVQTG